MIMVVDSDTNSENASTVSTIIVFILEMVKSTMPTGSVPMAEAALLISSRPITEALQIIPIPRIAAATTPKSGT